MSYDLDPKELTKFVRLTFENTRRSDVENVVIPVYKDKLNEVDGIMSKLKIKKEVGVRSIEVKDRRQVFGENRVEEDPQDPLWKLMWEALQDPTLIFLSFAAAFSLFIAVFIEQRPLGWLEGVAILFAVVVVVTVGAVNDYQKETQFRLLNAKKEDVPITVLRDGKTSKVSTFDLVVGDIILLSTGDIIPTDGVIIGRNDLELNEKMLTGETLMKKKSSSFVIQGENIKSSPTLFAGTFVQAGEGRMLVVAVGTNTYQGSMEEKMKEAETGRSIMQKKLDAMTDLITTVSMYVSIALVLILLARMGYAFYTKQCCMESWDHKVHWSEVLGFVITGITIFVVAVPEGLPLAVTIALAFSVKKMLADQNLVRHLNACETMGGATTICSDKTGTLTTSRMTVVRMWLADRIHDRLDDARIVVDRGMLKLVCEAAVINTLFKTYLRPPETEGGYPVYCGNDTECALLAMADSLGVAYEKVREEFPDQEPRRRCFTFSSDRKRMTTVVPYQGTLTAFVKGAAEMVTALCIRYLDDEGPRDLTGQLAKAVNQAVSDFADQGLRTIAIAMKELPANSDLVALTADQVEKDLTLVALVGIEDPLRSEVPAAIADCKRAGIVVRMVTGDNGQTARAIALKCGILTEGGGETVMDGKEFRERVTDGQGNLVQAEFDRVWPDLRVLARSTPLDKHLLVSGLQASTKSTPQTVAVTGDGTNDAPALKKADVGFAMGIQGTEVAKNASDVIIMDDNFVSIVAAVKWGRCVYDNICKFLQFQLTVNITACSLACVGAAVLTESPLTAIQMLWVNLIMDSFASLALATENPNRALLDRKPYPRDQAVLSQTMVRNMVCHALWQLAVLSFLIFGLGDVCEGNGDTCHGPILVDKFGPLRSGRPVPFDMNSLAGTCLPPDQRPVDYCAKGEKRQRDGWQTHGHGEPTQHYTIVFNVFVLLQVFNEVNARKIHGEVNVFQGILGHGLFLSIVLGTLVVQGLLVQVPGLNTAFGCTALTQEQWLACILIGASSIPMNVVFGLVPPALFPSGGGGIPPLDKEEEEAAAREKKEQ